jgi:para-nitrobenzyl esterase
MTTIAHTTSGRVEGREKEGVVLFASIPYAAPPVGPLRFKPAQPHPPWSEVRKALRFGPAAPQLPGEGLTGQPKVQWDEDCLTLNVATPALDGARRPVLFWIHGGAYRTGQGAIPWYNGARFARNGDIVVVSINYRLGALGFAHLARFGDEYATSGVNGTLDQCTALKWVRDNIESFGGDPDNVTIAGESAGGFSVGTLLGSPRAAGLFHRAIPQSGAAHHTLPPAMADRVTDLLCDLLAIRSADHLHALSVGEILEAQAKIESELGRGDALKSPLGSTVPPLYPVTDGAVIPQHPIDAIRGGAGADVPVLIGTNRDETTLWGYGKVDEERLGRIVAALGGDEELLETYRRARPDASPGELVIALTTDHLFRIPAIRLAEARDAHPARTWMYLFAWESRAFGGRLKATHALEIPFVFDNLDRGGVDVFLGEGPRPQHIADVMHAAWTAFIRTGEPSCEALPDWPAYDLERRPTVVFADDSRVVDDPAGDERRAWDGRR